MFTFSNAIKFNYSRQIMVIHAMTWTIISAYVSDSLAREVDSTECQGSETWSHNADLSFAYALSDHIIRAVACSRVQTTLSHR
ncbi:unnamed protein product [Microthlaspi erraticum]|uniref:Uncharacterized protein n=1 Tax=Microthlaspi erraticum TaxID=1685480 RepID=A0A6D2IVV3_9BRAS|nr:unnamed protein product [Microthlaspi erraticum]